MTRALTFICLITFIACNNASNGKVDEPIDTNTGDSTVMKIQIPGSKCYRSITGKDTFNLKVETFPNVVTGSLTYNFFEKDKSSGELEGYLLGDTLVANYSFMSEGQRSVRQVVFLIKDGEATEGYGDMEEKEGGVVFKDFRKVDFSKGLVLKEVSCVENEQPVE